MLRWNVSWLTDGRSRGDGKIRHFPLEQFNRLIQINLVGTVRCVAKCAAGMITLDTLADGERGVIIATASITAVDGMPGNAAYSTSKAGVMGMTLPIARDLMDDGVRINSILPGLFETQMLQGVGDRGVTPHAESIPLPKRLGRPSEFAKLVCVMIENIYFNGESVRLDAGLRLTR